MTREYSFRLKFIVSDRVYLDCDNNKCQLHDTLTSSQILLSPQNKDQTIKTSKELIISGSRCSSSQEASKVADRIRDILTVVFARLRLGVDFGDGGPHGGFTEEGLKEIETKTGQRVLNDIHGLAVYETNPQPFFLSISAKGARNVDAGKLESIFNSLSKFAIQLSLQERLAFNLFSASFFAQTPDVRLLLLMMATETLMQQNSRPTSAVKHVEELIELTSENKDIGSDEKKSIIGSLKWLKAESINQAGRRMAAERLTGKKYLNKEAPSFFSYCYALRSKLVHGEVPRPDQSSVGTAAAWLELFVSDLITQPYLELD